MATSVPEGFALCPSSEIAPQPTTVSGMLAWMGLALAVILSLAALLIQIASTVLSARTTFAKGTPLARSKLIAVKVTIASMVFACFLKVPPAKIPPNALPAFVQRDNAIAATFCRNAAKTKIAGTLRFVIMKCAKCRFLEDVMPLMNVLQM